MKTRPLLPLSAIAVSAILSASIIPSAQAVNASWTGLGADSNWATEGNWSGSPVPGAGNTATFNGAGNGNTTIVIGGTISLSGITFDTANAAAYTVGSNTDTIQGLSTSAVTMNSTVTANEAVNANMVLANTVSLKSTFTNTSTTGLLTIGGNISGGTITGAQTVQIAGPGNITISGGISNGGATTGVALLKGNVNNLYGGGVLTLTGSNTYTGLTTISSGTVVVDMNAGGSLTGGGLTLGGGALQVKGKDDAQSASSLGGSLFLIANTGSVITLASGTGTGSLTFTLGNTWTRNAGSTLNIDISSTAGAGQTLKTTGGLGAGTQTSNQNVLGYATVKDSTGVGFATNVGGNIVRYTGAAALTAAANSSNTNYAFNTSGTLAMDNTAHQTKSLSIDTTAGDATLDLGGASNVLSFGSGLLMTGANNATIQNGVIGGTNGELIVNQFGTGSLTLAGTISGGSGSLTKAGSGTLIITGANTYTGATTINAGTVQISAANNLGDNTSATNKIYLNNGVLQSTSGTYDLGANRVITVGGASGSGAAGVIQTDAGNLTISGSIVLNSNPLTIQGAGDTTISGVIGGDYAYLTKTGAGTLTLSGNQTTAAPSMIIKQGAVNVTGTYKTSINGDCAVVVDGADASFNQSSTSAMYIAKTLTVKNGSVVLGGTSQIGFAGGGYPEWGTFINGGTLSLTGTAYSHIYVNGGNFIESSTGVLSGTSNKVLSVTSGTAILAGVNTYTGATTVNGGGMLIINGNNTAATGAVTVNAGGTLGGSGIIGGAVTIQGGADAATRGTISLVDGGVGTLTLNKGLTLLGFAGKAAALNFELGTSAGVSDKIAVAGVLDLSFQGGYISLTNLGNVEKGDYTLLSFASSTGTGKLTFADGKNTYASAGRKYTLSTTTTAGNLNVSEYHDRVVAASNVDFGNVFVGRAVSGTSNLTTTGDTDAGSNVYYTSVKVDGQTFNNSGSTGSHVINQTFGTSGSKNSSDALTVTGEGLTGEAPVAVNAGYTANVFQEALLSTNSPTISGGSNTADLTLTNAASTDGGQRAGVTVTSLTANNSNFTTTLAGDASVGTATTSDVTATVGTVSVASDRLNGTYTGTVTGAAQYTDSTLRSQANVGNVNWSVVVSGSVGGQTSTGSADVKQAFVANGSSYAGYGLTSGITGGKGSVATLLGGTASGDATVRMSYITATEFADAGKVDSAQRVADILTISGVAPKSGTGFDGSSLTDQFVLQISFTGTEGYVAWYDTELGRFVNAIAGNSTVEGGQGILEAGLGFGNYFANTAYNDTLNVLGNYGYDAATHTAWAVVDHNSDFTVLAAVPEPSTWAMMVGGIGMLAFGQRLRRRNVV